jgi:hypothetical protein
MLFQSNGKMKKPRRLAPAGPSLRITPHAGQRPAGRDRMVIQLARGHRVSVPTAVELSRQGKTLRVGAEA